MARAYYNTSSTGTNFVALTPDMVGAAAASHTHSGYALSTHTHDGLSVRDTRNDNLSPAQYASAGYGNKTRIEFKYASKVNSPTGGQTYGALLTYMPWGESSGGNAYQIFLNSSGNTPYPSIRTASLSGTSWGGWYDFVTEANPEIVVSSSQPTNSNAKLWVKV